MFKMLQSEGSLILDPFDGLGLFSPFKKINSIANSYINELKNTGHKELNSNTLVDIIGKKIKKEFLQLRVQE